MSASGAGSETDAPAVVTACMPSSSKSVPKKMYAPAVKMYALRKRVFLLPFSCASPSNSPTPCSSRSWSLPGLSLNLGTANILSSSAASSSTPVTQNAEISAGFTVMPKNPIRADS